MDLFIELVGFRRRERIVLRKADWIFSNIFDEASVIINMDPLSGATLKINLKEAITWSNATDISKCRLLTTTV